MDESTLLNQLKTLESSWGSLDRWLDFWVALVVIGVAIEVIVVVIEYRHELHAFDRGIIRPPDKPSIALFTFGLLGAGLVAIGVAGEFWIHIKAGKLESDMRDANRQLVALVNQRAATAGREAAEAKLKLAELQKATLPRTLDPKRVASKIGGFGRIGTVMCTLTDFEPAHTAALIRAALDLAGWTGPNTPSASAGFGGSGPDELRMPGVWIEVSPMSETSPGPTMGVAVKHSPDERAKELHRLNRAAKALELALNAEGIEAKRRPLSAGFNTSGLASDEIRIFVSLRPMPGMPDLTVIKTTPGK